MGFANLKKTSQSVNRRDFTVDEFIDDALDYAKGRPRVVGLHLNKFADERATENTTVLRDDDDEPFRRATFTLSNDAIEKLTLLSMQTGIARSRLMRIWLDEHDKTSDLEPYLLSQVR